MKKYRITLSEEQLRLISKAVEDWSRFMAGQCEMLNAETILSMGGTETHYLRELLTTSIPELIAPDLAKKYGPGASYGWSGATCPNEYQKNAIAMSYYIYREILHYFAVSHPTNHYNVYQSETLRCPEQGDDIIIEEV
jgi:hypothetical protein